MNTEQINAEELTELGIESEAFGASASNSSWVRRHLRRIASSQLLMWAALVIVFSVLPLLWLQAGNVTDADIWWHMRTGEWILQHHQIPHVDPFSATTMGHPWVDYSWLFDLGANFVVAHFDLASILWFQIAMYAVITAALLNLLSSLGMRFWAALGLTALAVFAMVQTFSPQPEAFTIFFFILEFHVLLWAERTGRFKALWALPVLFALWANIHIEFVSGLFLLGAFCIEPALEWPFRHSSETARETRLPHRQLWLVLMASLLATLANPFGVGLYQTAIHYARDTKVYDLISELHAMEFRNLDDWLVLLLLMLGCFCLGRSRRVRPVWLLLMTWAAWMSFRSLKEMWLVPVVACALIASRHRWNPVSRRKIGLQLPSATAATVFVVLIAGAGYLHANSQRLLRVVSDSYPVGAVSYIHQHHLQGPILNDFSWGGFLIYALPEIPVYIDGRTNVHSQEEVLQAIALYRGDPGWHRNPGLRQAKLVICSYSLPLAALLARDPHYRVVYNDATSLLFEAVEPANNGKSEGPAKP
ncbi:MAG TPA: hypothetical protein VFQ00_05240 [Terriglobales bacterium]|nr:hypothetical protein [Terriglobales bacterium]